MEWLALFRPSFSLVLSFPFVRSHKIRLRWCECGNRKISFYALAKKTLTNSFIRKRHAGPIEFITLDALLSCICISLSSFLGVRVYFCLCMRVRKHIWKLKEPLTMAFVLLESFHFDRCDRLDSFVLWHFWRGERKIERKRALTKGETFSFAWTLFANIQILNEITLLRQKQINYIECRRPCFRQYMCILSFNKSSNRMYTSNNYY